LSCLSLTRRLMCGGQNHEDRVLTMIRLASQNSSSCESAILHRLACSAECSFASTGIRPYRCLRQLIISSITLSIVISQATSTMKRSSGVHTHLCVLYEESAQSISIFCHSRQLPYVRTACVRDMSNWSVATVYVYALHPFREAGSVRWRISPTSHKCSFAVFGDQPSLSQISFVSQSFKIRT
jgi:hypothetical protein